MTNSQLIAWVRTRLGDPEIDVELDNTQIQAAIDQAIRMWSRQMPVENMGQVQVVAGVQAYDLSAIYSGIRGVVYYQEEPIDFNSSVEFDIFRDRVWHLPVPNVTDIALDQVYLNTLRYVGSTEGEWRYDPVTRKLWISPIPSRAYKAFIIYTTDPTVDQATAKYDWVPEMSLAISKETLGLIRRKHGDKIPGRELEIPLDGAALIQEAKDTKDKLVEQLDGLGGQWVLPIRG